jgi:hypothetical protein
MECSLKNCFEFMQKQLILTIDNYLKIKHKDDKQKLKRLDDYIKIFNKKHIDMKDIRLFYKEFTVLYKNLFKDNLEVSLNIFHN